MKLLRDLSNAIGVSGNEGEIRKLIIPAIKPYADEITIDTIGNVFAYKATTDPAGASHPTVMITAHLDEIGLMITDVTNDGMLRFTAVGGLDPRILLGQTVLVGPEKIPGVIGAEAIHNLSSGQYNKAPTIKSLAIDIGASNKEAALTKVALGDYATFDTQFSYLNNDPDDDKSGVVKGKALDNRAGCMMLVELLKQTHPVNLIGVFTVQEEIGTRGAHIAAHKANPNMAIVLECTTADDLPRKDEEIGYPRLGEGPCITIMDRSFIAHPRLLNLVESTAKKHNIPYQYKKPSMGGTDAGAIHQSRAGIPAITIAAPARYIHSPAALMDLGDFWHCITLVAKTLDELAEAISHQSSPGN